MCTFFLKASVLQIRVQIRKCSEGSLYTHADLPRRRISAHPSTAPFVVWFGVGVVTRARRARWIAHRIPAIVLQEWRILGLKCPQLLPFPTLDTRILVNSDVSVSVPRAGGLAAFRFCQKFPHEHEQRFKRRTIQFTSRGRESEARTIE